MDIVRLVEESLSNSTMFLSAIEGGIDYATLERQLKKELDALGCSLLQEGLTAMDEKIYQKKDRKKQWKVIRKKKAILSFASMCLRTVDWNISMCE